MLNSLLSFLRSDTWEIISALAVAFDLLSFVPIMWFIHNVREAHKNKMWEQRLQKNCGGKHAVLTVSIGMDPRAIETGIIVFINQLKNTSTKAAPDSAEAGLVGVDKTNFYHVHAAGQMPMAVQNNAAISSKAVDFTHALSNDLQARISEMKKNEITVVHLFCVGPLSPMLIVGAQLANKFKVICYQYDTTTGRYVGVGQLK